MTPSNDDFYPLPPDDESALAAWDLACRHADTALQYSQHADIILAIDTPGTFQAAMTLKDKAEYHCIMAAAYLAVGGYGNDRLAHVTCNAPYTTVEPLDGWDL